jgi:hypothetical protein
MPTKRTILYFNIDPKIRNRYKAAAALRGKSLKEWALDAMREKLERDMRTSGLKDFLGLADVLHPRIAAGTKGNMDAAKDIQALREERLRAFGP